MLGWRGVVWGLWRAVAGIVSGIAESAVQTHSREIRATDRSTAGARAKGERKQVTVLFADLKGSMELLADRDPEEARKLLDLTLKARLQPLVGSSCPARAVGSAYTQPPARR